MPIAYRSREIILVDDVNPSFCDYDCYQLDNWNDPNPICSFFSEGLDKIGNRICRHEKCLKANLQGMRFPPNIKNDFESLFLDYEMSEKLSEKLQELGKKIENWFEKEYQ